jgi:hypothetical protein
MLSFTHYPLAIETGKYSNGGLKPDTVISDKLVLDKGRSPRSYTLRAHPQKAGLFRLQTSDLIGFVSFTTPNEDNYSIGVNRNGCMLITAAMKYDRSIPEVEVKHSLPKLSPFTSEVRMKHVSKFTLNEVFRRHNSVAENLRGNRKDVTKLEMMVELLNLFNNIPRIGSEL